MGSKRVHIRVGENRRDKWNRHASDDFSDKYGSVSALIRTAVETQIDIDKGNLSAGADASDGTQTVEANGRIDDILTGVEDNGTALEAIQSRLDRLHEQVSAGGGVSDKVFSDVFGALVEIEASAGVTERINRALTPTDVAEKAGVSVEQAEAALAQMRREYDDVSMAFDPEEHDEPRYWKEV